MDTQKRIHSDVRQRINKLAHAKGLKAEIEAKEKLLALAQEATDQRTPTAAVLEIVTQHAG